jgi:fibro-slime domain-containing protein
MVERAWGKARLAGLMISVVPLVWACGGDDLGSRIETGSGGGNSGSGTSSGGNGSGANGSGAFNPTGSGGGDATSGSGAGSQGCDNMLVGVIRDFQSSHPDFEGVLGTDKGIVEQDIGTDQKPVYAGNPTTPTTNGQDAFDQWYRDVDGVNMTIPLSIPLTDAGGGIFTFDDSEFFPIDGQGFGDEGNPHNYHFTYEIHAEFTYEGGEVFTFTGDDDLFTFINGKLAIDLGGVHGPQTATIDLDQEANNLGITQGETYPLDFFFAERHTTQSNFRIDTTIDCFSEVPIPQ